MLRVPLLSAEAGLAALAEPVDQTRARRWLQDNVFSAALWVSNRRFYLQMQQRLADEIPVTVSDLDTLAAYRIRMATRCTPFGFNATFSLGQVEHTTAVQDVAACLPRTLTRPSSELVGRIVRNVAGDPEVIRSVHWRLNPTLVRIGGEVRFVHVEIADETRRFVQREAELDPALKAVLDLMSSSWHTFGEIVQSLMAVLVSDADEVASYVDLLVREQILVNGIEPPSTGTDPLAWLIDAIPQVPSQCDVVPRLLSLQASLASLDTAAEGAWLTRADAAHSAAQLCLGGELSGGKAPENLLQIDAYRDLQECSLGTAVVERIGEALLFAHRSFYRRNDALQDFVARFQRRFEDAEVPLLLALDDDYGVPMDVIRGHQVDLLEGISLVDQPQRTNDISVDKRVLEVLIQGLHDGSGEVVLPDELPVDWQSADEKLPRSVFALASVLAADVHSIERGEYEVYLDSFGSSGSDLFGRFCRDDSPLTRRVRNFIADSEPDGGGEVWAEVAHLPQDSVGNVVFRPTLRSVELNCMGTTSKGACKVLELSDLTISLRHGEFVLRHVPTGQRVRPRITNAHNFARQDNLPLYKLMGYLQHQTEVLGGFSWGSLAMVGQVFPRVRWKNVILSRRAWRIPTELATKCGAMRELEFDAALRAFAQRTALPPRFLAGFGDQKLLCSLDSATSVRLLQKLVRKYGAGCLLQEVPELNRGLWLGGDQARFFGQFLLPYSRFDDRLITRANEE